MDRPAIHPAEATDRYNPGLSALQAASRTNTPPSATIFLGGMSVVDSDTMFNDLTI